jgi:hypothetical protein
MEAILANLNQAGLFEKEFGTFHFLDAQGFNGHWNITDAQAWSAFDVQFAFGQLAARVAYRSGIGECYISTYIFDKVFCFF